MASRKRRRADGSLRPAYRRYRARKRRELMTEEQRQARREWLANFEPGARSRFFKHSLALRGEAVWLSAFARELGLEQAEAAALLEQTANERRWMKLRTRDGTVVGISPAKRAKQAQVAA